MDKAPAAVGEQQVEQAVTQGSAYEVIRKRLLEQGNRLEALATGLNKQRLEEFGSTEMQVIGRTRVRTENNCVARDIVRVGDSLLFGYNVFLGLKKSTQVADVFSVYKLVERDGNPEMDAVPIENTFLADARFQSDFNELYTYYKNTVLTLLVVWDGKLLASFQIGERAADQRVFRWSVSADGQRIEYIDNRGERDIQLPSPQDFEWRPVARELIVEGRHPHLNILDTIFVDTIGGDLTIKVENNTATGKGVYSDPVADPNQSLDDAEFFFAELGQLILLKIRPYQEPQWRYLVFNRLNESVVRIDAIGDSCVQLPDNHGILFPGGFYLQTGDYKTFDEPNAGLRFKRAIKSPNGEDVLYLLYEPVNGLVALYPYNLIERQLRTPLYAHGCARFEDGRMLMFQAESEPTRVHPMQLWQTPFYSDVHASQTQQSRTFFGRIGNADLVRGISDLFGVCQLVRKPDAQATHYHELCKYAGRLFDQYHWIGATEMQETAALLHQIVETGELILDEYEKVAAIRRSSGEALDKADAQTRALLKQIQPDSWTTPQPFVQGLADIRKMRGHLLTIGEYRYIDKNRITELDQQLDKARLQLSQRTVEFLAKEEALKPLYRDLGELDKQIAAIAIRAELEAPLQKLDQLSQGLDLLTETISGITSAEANTRTRIIDAISALYSQLNQVRARAQNQVKNLGSAEALAQFSAQFKLLAQSVTNGLALSNTPERCDEQLSRIMTQLQELESQFGEHDEFLADILGKREEIFESFETHKQQLLDERQRRAQTLLDAANRIIDGIKRRSGKFRNEDEHNTFFSSDPLVEKLRQLAQQLRGLDDSVKADDIEARLKALKDQSVRGLRDKADIYEADGNVVKLGPLHRFSVNQQELDLTLLPRDGALYFHLTGTDFYEALDAETLAGTQAFWSMSLPSENQQVSRAEYLAYSVLRHAESGTEQLSLDQLRQARQQPDGLLNCVRRYAEPRYREGYERGIHDHDATLILDQLLPLYEMADLLRFDPPTRALATLFWSRYCRDAHTGIWPARAQSALHMLNLFGSANALQQLQNEIQQQLRDFLHQQQIETDSAQSARAAQYLLRELARPQAEFVITRAALTLVEQLRMALNTANAAATFDETVKNLQEQPGAAWRFVLGWVQAWLHRQADSASTHNTLTPYAEEAAARLLVDTRLRWQPRELNLQFSVEKLLSSHATIQQGNLPIRLDEFLLRLQQHADHTVPTYLQFLETRQRIIEQEKRRLRLDQFKPRPLSSFVRNKLISESYLPIIGANLAKQMGTVGENRRTDLMGLLMLISPPGYGKTTLMEYVAHRLGLIFMKINCPSLGHQVDSLDPQQAPNATARQELEKLNLALEMGNNVMLYLDDIQHTNPEFLQKFISLCDGTRRIEGVWKGVTKTYDMRGKKFCVGMAGNPYTESGELFKIPDMLANRADIYNLGDVLGGMEEVFALSYIENSMTSNPVLAPLATRDMADFYCFVDAARGRAFNEVELKHPYSAAESREIIETLQKLFRIQQVVLKVNQQYIASAAQDDKFRTEPPFKLQGSYRNMNKMAEKISAVMTDAELLTLIDDHYLGEAQLLTSGTEANLLKLAELRGNMQEAQQQRWQAIKKEFQRLKQTGGDEADVGTRVVMQLHALGEAVGQVSATLNDSRTAQQNEHLKTLVHSVEQNQQQVSKRIEKALQAFAEAAAQMRCEVEVINQPVPGIDLMLKTLADTLENSIYPLVKTMDGKLGLDLRTHDKMQQVLDQLRTLDARVKTSPPQGK
ncbi:MAG: AAA family ATPase [Gammaproteobacteria bacterium]|nr:AAA family ATPase [Gammaproteobacteria bacterium]